MLLELIDTLMNRGIVLIYCDDLVVTNEAWEIILAFIQHLNVISNMKADAISRS